MKQFFRFTTLWVSYTFVSLALLTPAQASFLRSGVSTPFTSGYEIVLDSTDPVVRGDIANTYLAKAQTSYGVNKVYAQSSVPGFQLIQNVSEWSVNFDLTGAPVGTPVQLLVSLDYAFSLSVFGVNNAASFSVEFNGNHFNPYYAHTTSNGFDTEACFDRPTLHQFGDCAGSHSGTITVALPYTAGLNRTLDVTVGTDAIANAIGDAFHTVGIRNIIVPDGIQWSYTDLSGNPLNFESAGQSGVPEPASFSLIAAGLSALMWISRRKARG